MPNVSPFTRGRGRARGAARAARRPRGLPVIEIRNRSDTDADNAVARAPYAFTSFAPAQFAWSRLAPSPPSVVTSFN